jgi:protein-disulfide isomerase
MNNEAKVLIGIAVVVIAVAGVLAFQKAPDRLPPGVALDDQSLMRENSYMTGSPDAKVTLVEFGDYECPACAAAHPVVKQILEAYQDNPEFNFVYRHFPLTEIHSYADLTAQAAEAAGVQGKFWEMHNILYDRQSQWAGSQARNYMIEYAKELGLNEDQFRQELDDKKFADIVKTDRADGSALFVNSTPTFFLNGEPLVGIPQFNTIKASIDAKLAE